MINYSNRAPIPTSAGNGPSWIWIVLTAVCQLWPIAGLLLFFKGRAFLKNKRLDDYRKLVRTIGPNVRMSLTSLRRMSAMDKDTLKKRLEEMIKAGYLGPDAYIDYQQDALVLDSAYAYEGQRVERDFDISLDFENLGNSLKNAAAAFANVVADSLDNMTDSLNGKPRKKAAKTPNNADYYREEPATQQSEPPKQPKQAEVNAEDVYSVPDTDDNDEILKKLKLLNDQIADESVSRKIDRIAALTNDINSAVRLRPDKQSEVRKFMNYYLPTTIKLLGSYALLERQSYRGENIRSSMANIDRILDTLIEAYEKQLDRMFAAEAMDISSDIKVLETMIAADGLTSQAMQMKL